MLIARVQKLVDDNVVQLPDALKEVGSKYDTDEVAVLFERLKAERIAEIRRQLDHLIAVQSGQAMDVDSESLKDDQADAMEVEEAVHRRQQEPQEPVVEGQEVEEITEKGQKVRRRNQKEEVKVAGAEEDVGEQGGKWSDKAKALMDDVIERFPALQTFKNPKYRSLNLNQLNRMLVKDGKVQSMEGLLVQLLRIALECQWVGTTGEVRQSAHQLFEHLHENNRVITRLLTYPPAPPPSQVPTSPNFRTHRTKK